MNFLHKLIKLIISMLVLAIPFLLLVVETKYRFSKFSIGYFMYGTTISTSSGVKSVLACIFTCGDTCGYVQYSPDGTCVLYSQAVLLTEPATVVGKLQGYRKVRHSFLFTYNVFANVHITFGTTISTSSSV